MHIWVEIHDSAIEFEAGNKPRHYYRMNHDDPTQRRVLGEQCRNAFEAGQCVVTIPETGHARA